MEHYEIRDTLRRASTPALSVALTLAGKRTAQLQFAPIKNIPSPLLSMCKSPTNHRSPPTTAWSTLA